MPLTPLPNVGSQLDRAIVAYLISVEAGTAANTYPSYCSTDKVFPNTTVKSHASAHDPDLTANEIFNVAIMAKFNAREETANPEAKRKAADERIGLIMAALLQSDDGQTLKATARAITAAGRALATSDNATVAANNADMADFTLQHWYYKGAVRGTPEDESCAWVEVRNFQATASPSNVD